MGHRRIAILGISASGKSFASRVVASKAKLPLFHMDQLFWKGNWEAVPEEEYLERHKSLIAQEEWIIEGYVEENMAERINRADLVLYLDYSGIRCAYQYVKRWISHHNVGRSEFAPEAREKFSFKFLWLVLTRGERPRIEGALSISKPTNLYRFSSPKDFKSYISKSKVG